MALSAANTQIRSPYETMIEDLGALLEGLPRGVDQHDRAIVVIEACIHEGVTGGAEIVQVGRRLGFNAQHVGMTLTKGAGNDPARHYWRRDKDGRYSLLGDAALDH